MGTDNDKAKIIGVVNNLKSDGDYQEVEPGMFRKMDTGWMRWAGVGLGVVVIASVHWVLGNLGRNVSETVLTKESHELVTSGPYRWIRHPLYTTGIALFVALGLIAANWFILLWAAAALVAIRLAVIPREERELRARFGRAYDDLVSRTGAMWPRAGINREK